MFPSSLFHHHIVVPPSVRRRSLPSVAAATAATAAATAVHRPSIRSPPFIKLTRFCGSDTISELLKILDFSSCAFEDPDIIHVDDIVDPVRDLEVITAELRLKDIEFMERRIEDLEKSMKRSNDKQLKVEHELCLKVKAWLESEKVIRKDLLIADTLEDDAPFPKLSVLQILRVMQIILENCHNKSSFDGLEVSEFLNFAFSIEKLGSNGSIQWHPSENAAVYRAWEKVMSSRFSDILGACRREAALRATEDNIKVGNNLFVLKQYTPSWIDQADWEDMIDRLWNTSRWKKKSAIARQNRLNEGSGDGTDEAVGSGTREYITRRSKRVADAVEAAMEDERTALSNQEGANVGRDDKTVARG
ncbi:OLA1 protein [Tanacetum coccineum]